MFDSVCVYFFPIRRPPISARRPTPSLHSALPFLAVDLAVTAVFLARNWIEYQARPVVVQQAAPVDNSVTVVVSKGRLTFGSPLRREQLRLVKWPGDAVPEGAFTSIEALVGGEEERVVLRALADRKSTRLNSRT